MMNISKSKCLAKYKTSVLSTGVLSLDNLLNGGLPIKTITLIEEDSMNIHCSLLCQNFVSYGLSNMQDTALIVDEFLPETYIENLHKFSHSATRTPKNKESMPELKIAWRYKQLPSYEGDILNSDSGNSDQTMDKSRLSSHYINKEKLSENLEDVLNFITKFIKEKGGIRKFLRLAIPSLGSPLWGTFDNQKDQISQLCRFLFCLRTLINDTSIVVVVTVNPDVFESNAMMVFRSLCQYVFKFQAFDDPQTVGDKLFSDISGQMRPIKIPSINSIEPIIRPNTLIWSYDIRRKKMLFKEFSLPPCLSENTSRTNQNDPSYSIMKAQSCGGGVDF